VALGVATAYFQFEQGSYTVSVATAGTTNVVASGNLSLTGGSAFTVLTRDAAGGGTPLGIVVEDDLD
jgi:basic membrane lipoprotein Med (substrate-binding protein (PBP1-ABC) superfamily)